MKRIFLLLLLAVMLFVAAGCTKPNDDILVPEETKGPSIDDRPNSVITEEETIYYVLDEEKNEIVVYFKENHPEVKAVKEVVEKNCSLIDTRDYRTIKGDEEYETYTQSYIDYLNEKNDKTETVNYYKEAKLKTKSMGIKEYKKASFNPTVTECLITFSSIFKVEEISEDASEKTGMKAGEVYGIDVLLKLIKQEDDSWLIDDSGHGELFIPDNSK